MPGIATPIIVFLCSAPGAGGLEPKGGAAPGVVASRVGWTAGAATPMMVCLPPPGRLGPLTGAGAGVAIGAAPTGATAGIPSIVLFNLVGGCGAGADISGAMPTMVFFNDPDGAFCRGASSGAGTGLLVVTASAPFVGGSLSAAPHEAQCAASGWLDDPHRGQAIMAGSLPRRSRRSPGV
jgi:hypothetical protein